MIPHCQVASHKQLFPPSTGFCIAIQTVSQYFAFTRWLRTWLTLANIRRNIEITKNEKDFFEDCVEKMLFFAYHPHAAHISSFKINIPSYHLQTTQRS